MITEEKIAAAAEAVIAGFRAALPEAIAEDWFEMRGSEHFGDEEIHPHLILAMLAVGALRGLESRFGKSLNEFQKRERSAALNAILASIHAVNDLADESSFLHDHQYGGTQ